MIRVFFDEAGNDAEFVLRAVPDRAGRYTVVKPFRYRDPLDADRTFLVPKPGTTFQTDLASVPSVATWLVPKDGTHTPAALLHDAMIGEPAFEGPPVTRPDADALFRDVMRYLDVPLLRRWMMWAAVSMATLMTPGETRSYRYYRVLIPVVVGALAVIGLASTLDLLDIHRVRVPLLGWIVSTSLPWMGERSAGGELVGGALAALVAAVVTPWLWLRWWRVGGLAGLTVIPFAVPIVVAGVSYVAYSAAELVLYYALKRTAGTDVEAPGAPSVVRRLAHGDGDLGAAPATT